MEFFGYLAAVFIGIILGILGSGGSILSIPILIYIFHIDTVLASAYSLFIVGVTSFVGAIPKYRHHLVQLRTGLIFGIPSIVSIFITRRWIVPAIPDIIGDAGSLIVTKRILILGIFALLMVIASVSMIRGRKETQVDNKRFRVFLVIVQGIIIGFLSGLVGAGGGFLVIPALVLLTGLPFKTAVGTSLIVIAINSLSGFLGDLMHTKMDWPFLLLITALAVIGILIGNKISKKLPQVKLRKAFGWFVLCVGCWILVRELLIA